MVTMTSADNALKSVYLGAVSEQLDTAINPLLVIVARGGGQIPLFGARAHAAVHAVLREAAHLFAPHVRRRSLYFCEQRVDGGVELFQH